jgi:type I restriction-modification system DNA methylase subunit
LVKLNLKNEVFRSELTQEDADRGIKNIKLTLFQKSQKLIDRFLFIFFAEDRGLLPPNSITLIINEYKQLAEMDRAEPLYDTYKLYFRYLDQGRAGTDKKAEIFAYNGGLFKPDAVLDSLLISDALLLKHTSTLTAYDFESQVDVNILGHIFENSLNEIESVNAEIEGTDFDKQKTKRKKDGVFYTPKYITKYIVDNTVGKLCTEKKLTLKLEDEEYHKGRKNRQKKTLEDLLTKLEEYREWLLNLTVCDPACGSGAFLNQALDYLIREHTYVDELKTALLGGTLVLSDVENTILERNIYGVDLNEESVEIAKLSLWLRTAQPRRKLNSLNNNIKCGNSLIDSKAVAGDKAFHWETEFPDVFAAGGFDVVIGNPPYVRQELLNPIKPYLELNYKVFEGTSDLFSYFYEKSFDILKEKGSFGFISNTFDKTKAAVTLRDYLTSSITFEKYVDFTEVQIFEGATTYPVIITASNTKSEKSEFQYVKIKKENDSSLIDTAELTTVIQQNLNSTNWNFVSKKTSSLYSKIRCFKSIKKVYGKCFRGLITGLNEAFIIDDKFEYSDNVKRIVEGKDIQKWVTPKLSKQLIIFESKSTELLFPDLDAEKQITENIKTQHPKIFEHLLEFEDKARKRYDKGDYWWELRNCAYYELLEQPKIIFPNLQNKGKFSLDETGVYVNAPAVFLPHSNKSLLAVLNSKLVWFFLKSICVVRSGGYIEVKPQYFEQIPIPDIEENKELEEFTTSNILNTSKLQSITSSFLTYLQSQFPIEKPSRKLEKWYELEFGEFTTELAKAAKKGAKEPGIDYTPISKTQEFEYMELFTTKKSEAQALKSEIDKTDKEIDAMVYELYGLSEEEIGIVEQS